jgi:hypothetical protein
MVRLGNPGWLHSQSGGRWELYVDDEQGTLCGRWNDQVVLLRGGGYERFGVCLCEYIAIRLDVRYKIGERTLTTLYMLRYCVHVRQSADGTLTLGGSGAFSAAQTPSGQNQILVYQNSDNAVKLVIVGIAQ